MKPLILLEDEPVLREELADYLQAQGYTVDAVASLAQFDQRFVPGEHVIAVIDLGLPDGDGLQLIAALRAAGHRLGIIVLTARGALPDRVLGLNCGADHYLPKTTDLDELAAVIAALARRLDVQDAPRWILQRSPRQLVPPGFAAIPLSAQDFLVLQALARGKDYVGRREIVAALGENYLDYDQRRLDTQMRRLRRKVEEACGLALPVSTQRNVGYRFDEPIEQRG